MMVHYMMSGNLPVTLVGRMTDDRQMHGPLNIEMSYFKAVGENRMSSLRSDDEVAQSRKEGTLRVIPIASPLEWILWTITDISMYAEQTIDLTGIIDSGASVIPVDDGSNFGLAYYSLMSVMSDSSSELHRSIMSTTFKLDLPRVLPALHDADAAAKIFVPSHVVGGSDGN